MEPLGRVSVRVFYQTGGLRVRGFTGCDDFRFFVCGFWGVQGFRDLPQSALETPGFAGFRV